MTRKYTPKAADAPTLAGNVIEFPSRFGFADAPQHGRINQHELTSIKALASYVAHNQNVREDVVRAFVQAQFNVNDIASLRRDDFQRVIEYLVDLRCDLLLN